MNQSYFENNDAKMPTTTTTANKDDDDDDIPYYYYCYWLCNRKAELEVYTDFGNIMHLCKGCYEIYDPEHRLKTEDISSLKLTMAKVVI